MATQAKPDNGDVGFSAENEHVKALVKLICEKKKLLDLPQATFDAVLPHLGKDPGKVLLDNSLDSQDEKSDVHQEWLRDTQNLGGQILHSRIYRLSTVPTLWERAITILLDQLNMNLYYLKGFSPYYPEDAEPAIIALADRRLRDIMVHRARVSNDQGLEWSPQFGLATIKQVCLYLPIVEDGKVVKKNTHWGKWITPDVKTFKLTHELLLELHSREVGEMLAEKVAGHLLPPELVEMVADCFYDRELLTSLKL